MTDKERKSETAGASGAVDPAKDAMKPAAGEASSDDAAKGKESAWASDKASEMTAAEFDKIINERDELKDRLMRAMAEMENIRRRTERDKADTAKYAISNFARDVVSVGDNIRRAIDAVPAEDAQSNPALTTLLEGVEMTERELLNVMERHGITRLEPKGERFDPNVHQAMFEVEDASVDAGTIVEVVQAGYQIADRVLRPAMVGISKGGPKHVRSDPPADEGDKAAADATPAEKPDCTPADVKKAPSTAKDDAVKPGSAAKASQPQKTPLPDPSRAPAASARDPEKAKPGARRPLGGRVDKSA